LHLPNPQVGVDRRRQPAQELTGSNVLMLGTPALSVPTSAVDATAAGGAASVGWLMIALPLVGAALLLLAGRRANGWGHWLGVLASAGSFVVGLLVVLQMFGLEADQRVMGLHLFTWLPVGDFSVDAGLRLDPLSLSFVLLITFVGTLIHVYSVAYMAQDVDRRRFFAYLNLFVAAML